MDGFIELTSHAITVEFSDLHFCKAAASVEGGCLTSPVPNLPFSIDDQSDWLHTLPKILSIQFLNHELEGSALDPFRTIVGDGFPFVKGFWWGRSSVGGSSFSHDCRWLWYHEDLRERESTIDGITWFGQLWPTSTVKNLLLPFFPFLDCFSMYITHIYIRSHSRPI